MLLPCILPVNPSPCPHIRVYLPPKHVLRPLAGCAAAHWVRVRHSASHMWCGFPEHQVFAVFSLIYCVSMGLQEGWLQPSVPLSNGCMVVDRFRGYLMVALRMRSVGIPQVEFVADPLCSAPAYPLIGL